MNIPPSLLLYPHILMDLRSVLIPCVKVKFILRKNLVPRCIPLLLNIFSKGQYFKLLKLQNVFFFFFLILSSFLPMVNRISLHIYKLYVGGRRKEQKWDPIVYIMKGFFFFFKPNNIQGNDLLSLLSSFFF